MAKEITLTRGFVALVDDCNYEWLNSYKWHASKGYAVRWSPYTLGTRHAIYMHRFILGLGLEDERQVDHINHNKLDNRECNLRACSRGENQCNTKARACEAHSRFKGVSWHRRECKWVAYIRFEQKLVHLGYYSNEESAAKAYDKAATEKFGEFACTNSSLGLFS